MENNITDEKIDKYFDVTGKALNKVKLAQAKYAKVHFKKAGEDFLDMANRYFEDAKHFKEQGKIVDAFACLNYAHGWLDAGARIGVFDVEGDNKLFTIDKESINLFISDEDENDVEDSGDDDFDDNQE
ncbi:MAG: DUF357 domain-containing protein [Candidatus Woesearchaeota archaeon]